MTDLMLQKMDEWVDYKGYLTIGFVVFLAILIAYSVDMPVIKLVIGWIFAVGFGATLGLTVSTSPHKVPMLSASLLFGCLGVCVELYRHDTFPDTDKSFFFYVLSYACLVIGIIYKTVKELKKRKGGPPQPPNL